MGLSEAVFYYNTLGVYWDMHTTGDEVHRMILFVLP